VYRHPKYRIRDEEPFSPELINEVAQPLAAKRHRIDGHDVNAASMAADVDVADNAYYKIRVYTDADGWGLGPPPYSMPTTGDGDPVTDGPVWEAVPNMSFTVTTGLGHLWINMWVQYIWHTFFLWVADSHHAYNYVSVSNDDGFGAGIRFAVRIDGEIYSGTATGHSDIRQVGSAAIKAEPEITTTPDVIGPQQPKSQHTAGVGPQCFPIRIFAIVPIDPGEHTVELVVCRVKFSRTYAPTATALVTSGTDRLHVYGRQAFIMEIPSWPSVAATASVEIPAMQSEDTVDQIALSTNRMAVLTTAYNNIPTGAIARGGLQHRQLPRAVYDWAQVSIEPGSGGVATDDFYPGYANTIGTVLEGVANRTNQSGWYLLEDAMGATFDTVANHPAAFNATDPGLFLVLANIQCASIERDGAHDVPSLFGQYAIAAEGDLDGTAVVQWHVNAASQALVNNFNTFGLPARADDVDPEEMDVAIMAIYDFRTVQLTSDIVRFGVVAASATMVGGAGSRCRNRWRHGSMQVFRFRPGVL